MIPITKNITVADEWGNQYETTWLRRAKGLVKNGRARWVDDTTIRLAHPPESISEDDTMEQTIETRYNNDGNAVIEALEASEKSGAGAAGISERYILDQIKTIAADNAHIIEALQALKDLDASQTTDTMNGGFGVEGKAQAIGQVVAARETTNQQMLRMLEKMYDHVGYSEMPPQKTEIENKLKIFDAICERLKGFSDHMGGTPAEVFEIIENLSNKIF